MITKESYEKALKTIDAYKAQENKIAFEKSDFNYNDFEKFYSFGSTPRNGDIVIAPTNQGGIPKEEYNFKRIVVDGYCLPDEFYGQDDEDNRYLFLNTDLYKIVMKSDNNINP